MVYKSLKTKDTYRFLQNVASRISTTDQSHMEVEMIGEEEEKLFGWRRSAVLQE